MQVWSALKPNNNDSEQPVHEIDLLSGHENDVNYVQFRLVILVRSTLICFIFHCLLIVVVATAICSGCSVASKLVTSDSWREENTLKFRNFWSINIFILISCSVFSYNKHSLRSLLKSGMLILCIQGTVMIT